MERDTFHVSYLSDKIPGAVFHGQAAKTVAYLRVSTAQQDVRTQRLAILDAIAQSCNTTAQTPNISGVKMARRLHHRSGIHMETV